MINLEYPKLLDLFPQHLAPKRSESASFLIWYLENYFRLDSLEAIDSVCDQNGDKGVDGIYVNEFDNTIDVFQSRISQKKDSSVGDASLREFCGTLTQFASPDVLQNLLETAGDAHVARLARRLDLLSKLGAYDIRGIYLSNLDLDGNGKAFLDATPAITFVGKSLLEATYVTDKRVEPVSAPTTFDITGLSMAEYIVDANARAIIVPLKAKELIRLKGIADQSLFDRNVRGSLGDTKVNRDIVSSIRNPVVHKQFPLFHNGITIICRRLEQSPEKVTIDEYFVVNGCQSLNSLFQNHVALTDNLRILTKIIQMDVASDLAETVTRFSNNQNGVKARDFKSNSPIQVRLQAEFARYYGGRYVFEIKRGERLPGGEVITNENAGLYMMAFDLKEPWATHRKYQVFDEKYATLYGRPEVTADRAVLCHVLMRVVDAACQEIHNRLIGKYVLTKHAMMYILRLILEQDPVGKNVIRNPREYIRSPDAEKRLQQCVHGILKDVVIDINGEIDPLGEDFDYRDKLRDEKWVHSLAQSVVSSYLKLVHRGRIQSFEDDWKKQNA